MDTYRKRTKKPRNNPCPHKNTTIKFLDNEDGTFTVYKGCHDCKTVIDSGMADATPSGK